MSAAPEGAISRICEEHGNDRSRLMDILLAVQKAFGCVDGRAVDRIAEIDRAVQTWHGSGFDG